MEDPSGSQQSADQPQTKTYSYMINMDGRVEDPTGDTCAMYAMKGVVVIVTVALIVAFAGHLLLGW